jgi:CRISPR/Cas system-associated protein endoribonuclease Cas2
MFVDLPIPELAYLIIGCVLGEDEMASEECREILKSGYRVFFLSRFFMFKEGISSLKSSADRATAQLRRLTSLVRVLSIRRKRHESVMSLVTGSGFKLLTASALR